MNPNECTLEICHTPSQAILRIGGRAGMNLSPQLKRVLYGLWERGCRRFVLDLSRCQTMDSTFLGVLLGFTIKMPAGPAGRPVVEIYRPNQRVADLFDTLGVAEYFPRRESLDMSGAGFEKLGQVGPPASKADLAATSLQAHKDLVEVNPANEPRFKDVIRFLEEDLQQSGEGGSK